jgi:hypothetical protein
VTKRIRFLAAVAAIWLVAAPSLAQAAFLQPNPQIEVEYKKPVFTAGQLSQYFNFTTIYDWLIVRRPLDELPYFLAPLKLPRRIKIEVDQCGAERRPYVPGGPVTICYELIDKIEKVAAKINNNNLKQTIIVGAFTQAVLHELAYAVFDVLQVPIWGRQDDAADRLSAFVLMQFSEAVASTTMIGSGEFFLLSNRTWTGSAFASPNSPEAQRFYNILCIAYGGDPLDFAGWTKSHNGQDPILPGQRARRCSYEYQQVRAAFDLRIMPYINPDVLLQVKAARWFQPGELRQ